MLSGSSSLFSTLLGEAVSNPPNPEPRPLSAREFGESVCSAAVDGLPKEEGPVSIQALLERWEALPTVYWTVSGSHGDLRLSSALSERRLPEWDRWLRLVRWLVKGDVHFSLSMGTFMASHRAVSRGNAPLANCNNTCGEGNSAVRSGSS